MVNPGYAEIGHVMEGKCRLGQVRACSGSFGPFMPCWARLCQVRQVRTG
jgi:hypothetical protein